MRKIVTNCLVSLLIIAMIVTAVLPAIGEKSSSIIIEETFKPVENQIDSNLPQSNAEFTPDNLGINSLSKDEFKNSKLNKVVVATSNVNELAMLLSGHEYRGLIGTESSNSRGIAFPVLEVSTEALNEIQNLPSVLGVYDYEEPNIESKGSFYDSFTALKSGAEVLTKQSTETNIDIGTDHHGAESAWANNFTGAGVKIATSTSGTDFGHYELAGRQAVITEEEAVTNDTLILDSSTVNTSNIRVNIPEYYKVLNNTFKIYKNTSLMTEGYNLTANGTIEFYPVIPPYTFVNASYVYRSPYYHYPIAFDSTSMSNYLATGLPSGTETPKDMWYVNTSSTDMHIYHSIVIDGANDFWDEMNIRGTSDSTYPTSVTSELKGRDNSADMKAKEFDLTSIYATSDANNWYVGFNVSPEVDIEALKWKREQDVNYGVYIDIDGNGTENGAAIDPLGNYITTSDNRRPEYAIYLYHTSYDWGITGSIIKWEANQTGIWKAYKTFVNWGANYTTGLWSKNKTVEIDYEGDISDVKIDLQSWSKNNTVKNATFYAWSNETGWNDYVFIYNIPLNATVGIGPSAGSELVQYNGTLQLRHNGMYYPIQSSESVPYYVFYNDTNVTLEMITGEQSFIKDFVEYSIPRQLIGNTNNFSMIMFTVASNQTCAQDTSPHNDNVNFAYLDWSGATTTLDNFAFVEAPQLYITTGIPTKSGRYHVGLHPDQNMIKGHYGRPVAVLLTDYYEVGVYDTVYVDLDNDKNFSDEIPAQEYGAYNDTLHFCPRNGTVRYENGTILHNGIHYAPYQISWENDITLIEDAIGGETIFHLNTNISAPPIIEKTVTESFTNTTKVYNTTGTEILDSDGCWNFSLGVGRIVNITLLMFNTSSGEWFTMLQGINYSLDYTNGVVFIIKPPDVIPPPGLEFYAYYNYLHSFTLIEDVNYTLNKINGEITLTSPLALGDKLFVYSYSYRIYLVESYDTHCFILYNGNNIEMELRDWTVSKNIDSDGGVGDGISYPDVSGGMAYFIADGMSPLPYSDIIVDRYGLLYESNRIPSNGELVAFFGEFDADSITGTQISTAINAGGIGRDNNNNSLVKGMAPNAKLIPVRGATPFDAWYFSVEGYDGKIDTTDDAQIVVISTSFPVEESGWDIYTKAADYIGTYYAEGKVVFVSGTGDSGSGYGTVGSPSSANAVITVGQGTEFDYRCYNPQAPPLLNRVYADYGASPRHGDILPSSGRGPNMLGNPEPDAITIGAFGFGSIPLNVDQDYTTPTDFDWFGGQWAWDLWSGSALSAAYTGGILAMIDEAYYKAEHQVTNEVILHATRNTSTVKLMHSPVVGSPVLTKNGTTIPATEYDFYANNGTIIFHQDITEGSWINATYTFTNEYPNVNVARSLLKSGADNMNYDALVQGAGFTNADRSTKLAANMDGLLIDKSYWVPGDYRGTRYEGFVKLMRPGESATETFTIENKNQTHSEDIGIYDAVFQRFGSVQMPMDITKTYDDKKIPGVINIEPYIAIGTELLKVTVTSQRKSTMQNYMGELFDWTDGNSNGFVEFPAEQNRMTYCIGTNHLELRYRDPLGRVHDGLVLQVKSFGGTGEPLTEWTITLEFYEKVDWSWLQVQNPPTTVGAGGTASFTASLNIPANASIGSYEGAIYIKQNESEEQIATGAGEMYYDRVFSNWFSLSGGDQGQLNDINLTSGNRVLVPQTTTIRWNGTTLIESIDYELMEGGWIQFYREISSGDRPYYTMDYLTVTAVEGKANQSAVWSGNVSVPNFVKGSLTVKKNDVIWNETEIITDENVLVALGGEKTAVLKNGNVVRQTLTITKNGTIWPQFGGTLEEVSTTTIGQNSTTLAHGNIVLGSAQIYVNDTLLPQSIEISPLDREEVQPLNATAQSRSEVLTVNPNPPFWDGKLSINGEDTPDMKIISYLIFEDGEPLTDGLDFNMHVDNIHGKFKLTHDPAGHAYNSTFTYYNSTLIVGYLEHGNVVSESYKIYKNGIVMKASEYLIDTRNGKITLLAELKANEIITASYIYNTFILDTKFGTIQFTDAFNGTYNLAVGYSYNNWSVELARGILTFADLLTPGINITANYTYARYTMNMEDGVVLFAMPLLPGEFVNCSYAHYSSVIPVFFNIGADKPNFTFGGGAQGLDLYNNNEIIGGYGGSGDRRFYYLDVREQGIYESPSENERLFIDINWENQLTDIDVHVYGGRRVVPAVSGNSLPGEVYGPHTVEFIGGSDATTSFFTTTGGPEEIVAPRISGGINVLELNNVGMNGSTANKEIFSAKVGTMYVDPIEVSYVTNKLYGKQTISMHSNVEWSGVGGIAGGPSAPEQLRNLTVTQDDPDWSHFATFEDQLASGKTVIKRTIEKCLIFDVHIWGHTDFGYKDVVDLDLGVFKDGSGEGAKLDGIVQSDEFYAMCADFDADEEVKLIAPPDGIYLIVVYGFDLVTDPAHYDMDITIVQGTGFGLSGKGDNILPAEKKGYFSSNQTEEPYNLTHLTVSWDLPGSTTGTMQGALYIGPGNGPMCMLIPIELVIDTSPPTVKSESIFPESGAITNTNKPTISAEVEDTDREEIDKNSVKLIVDEVDVTSISKVSVILVEDSAKGGYPRGGAQYTPTIPLAEGSHTAEIVAMDLAGNEVRSKWAFTVDTRNPELNVDMNSRTYTNQDRIQVKGMSAPDVEIEVRAGALSTEVRRDPVGGFSTNIDLVEGDNLVTIIASDSAGNQVKKVLTITQDKNIPTFEKLICLDGTLTNQPNSVLSGSMSETGTLSVNGDPSPVNSDGTFDKYVELNEGLNFFILKFTDQAGNNATRWLNVTLDTQFPLIEVSDHETTIKTQDFNLSGSTEIGATLKVNGKLVQVDTGGNFNKLLQLSPGTNTIVVESKDAAGNINEIYLTMNYDTTGTNYGAIGLMVVLIILGLIVGMLFARYFLWPPAEAPEEAEKEAVSEEELEEAGPEELEEPKEEEVTEAPEGPEETEAPAIPKEEALPEDLPEAEPEAKKPQTEDMTSEQIADEITAEETVGEAISQKKPPTMEEEIMVEDEKILKLRKAYEAGKISKELYEKNLKLLQEKK